MLLLIDNDVLTTRRLLFFVKMSVVYQTTHCQINFWQKKGLEVLVTGTSPTDGFMNQPHRRFYNGTHLNNTETDSERVQIVPARTRLYFKMLSPCWVCLFWCFQCTRSAQKGISNRTCVPDFLLQPSPSTKWHFCKTENHV